MTRTPDHVGILINRATVEAMVEIDCEACGYIQVFLARVGKDVIPVDLSTVLKCLKLAEEEGALPPLPLEWWITVTTRHANFEEVFYGKVRSSCRCTS